MCCARRSTATRRSALRILGRFVLGYGNYLGAPWEWSNSPEFRRFVSDNFSSPDDMMGLQLAFDVTGSEGFPEEGAFRAAREAHLRVTTHAGVWGATTDTSISQMFDGGWMTDKVGVRALLISRPQQPSQDRRHGRHGLRGDGERAERRSGVSVDLADEEVRTANSLSTDTSVWWGADFFRRCGRRRARSWLAITSRRRRRGSNRANVNRLRAEDVVWSATMGVARHLLTCWAPSPSGRRPTSCC